MINVDISKLVQVDSTQNSADVMQNNLPNIFVPIRDKQMAVADIKYFCVKSGKSEKFGNIYNIVAAKDFCDREGGLVRKGSVGGFVDVNTFVSHSDKSWLDMESRAFCASFSGDSLVKKSSIANAKVDNSILISSSVEMAVLDGIADSSLINSEVSGSCSVVKSQLKDCKLYDRSHVSQCVLDDCLLGFAHLDNEVGTSLVVEGDVNNVAPAKDTQKAFSKEIFYALFDTKQKG